MKSENLSAITARIVSTYVGAHKVEAEQLKNLILLVFGALAPEPAAADDVVLDKLTPAQIRKSITPAVLFSFEDGKGYKTLKRHLTLRGLTPAEYRLKWGLPHDYPMISALYAARRSELAKDVGLGLKKRDVETKPPARQARTTKRRGAPEAGSSNGRALA